MLADDASGSALPPTVVYLESTSKLKANDKRLAECVDELNVTLPGIGQVYYQDKRIHIASAVFAYSVDYAASQLGQISTLSTKGINLAETCT